MSKSHPTLRKLKGASVDTHWGVCKACGRRGLLRSDVHMCAESARIPACEKRQERARHRAELLAEATKAAEGVQLDD